MDSKAAKVWMVISATGRSTSRLLIIGRPQPLDLRPGMHRGAGFSLLEVLVVVFIIGILATMFTLSVGLVGDDRRLDTEVDRLIAVIGLAREESVIEGREIGMRFFPNGYEFAGYYEDFNDYHDEDTPDQSEWSLLPESTLLGPRLLPAGLRFELQIDGREVVLKRDDEAQPVDTNDDMDSDTDDPDEQDRYKPQIMIFSSGDMSPFIVQIRREFENRGKIIEFDVDGSTKVTEAYP